MKYCLPFVLWASVISTAFGSEQFDPDKPPKYPSEQDTKTVIDADTPIRRAEYQRIMEEVRRRRQENNERYLEHKRYLKGLHKEDIDKMRAGEPPRKAGVMAAPIADAKWKRRTGEITWPVAIRLEPFDDPRKELESQLVRYGKGDYIYYEAKPELDEIASTLQELARMLHSRHAIEARSFLKSLEQELLIGELPSNEQDQPQQVVSSSSSGQDAPQRMRETPRNDTGNRTTARNNLLDESIVGKWQVAVEGKFADHGKVEFGRDAVVLKKGRPATGIRWPEQFPTSNYEVTLDAMKREGGDFFCGLTFPVGRDFCTLIIGGWGGKVTGLSNVDGKAANANQTTQSHTFEQNRWYSLRLRITDEQVAVQLDNDEIINLVRKQRQLSVWTEQEPMKPFGICTWQTEGAVRNIRVRLLDSQE